MKSKITLSCAHLILALFISISLSAQNSVKITSAPSSVAVGSSQNVKVSYTKTDTSKGYVQIWLKNASNVKVKEWTKSVTSKSGTVNFSIKIPQTPKGSRYRWYAQLVNGQWKGVARINGPTVSVGTVTPDPDTPSTSESLSFSSPPSSVKIGSSYTLKVGYSKKGNAKAYVQLWLRRSNGTKVKEWTKAVTSTRGTVTFKIEIPQTANGSYNWYTQLVNSSWSRLTYTNGPSVSVGTTPNGGSTGLGVCSQSDRNNGVKCYTQGGPNVRTFDQDMGNGYWSNWYVSGPPYTPNNPFRGFIKANFKRGTKAWVEWENKSNDPYKHEEFDLKIQKSAWKSNSGGLPARISKIQGAINTSMSGNYSSGSQGKGHINMTAWVTRKGSEVSRDEAWSSGRVDIIVHAFDNSGKFYKKYDDGPNGKYSNMGLLKSGGKDYRLLRTRPGNAGELASYNLIPDDVVNPYPYGIISTRTISSKINMKDIIEKVIAKERNFNGVKIPITSNWSIFILEWTVVGQSGAFNNDGSGKFIPNSKGRFTFSSYSIPNVKTSSALKAKLAVQDSIVVADELVDFNVSPNPFNNSFEYEYSVEKDEPVTVNLYALDGRIVKTLKNSEDHRAGNYNDVIDTSDLNAGIYLLRISSSEGERTIKLVKN